MLLQTYLCTSDDDCDSDGGDGDDTYLCLFSLRGALLKVSGYHLLKLKINNTISLGGLHLGGVLMYCKLCQHQTLAMVQYNIGWWLVLSSTVVH